MPITRRLKGENVEKWFASGVAPPGSLHRIIALHHRLKKRIFSDLWSTRESRIGELKEGGWFYSD
jgi:hypothetical protein